MSGALSAGAGASGRFIRFGRGIVMGACGSAFGALGFDIGAFGIGAGSIGSLSTGSGISAGAGSTTGSGGISLSGNLSVVIGSVSEVIGDDAEPPS